MNTRENKILNVSLYTSAPDFGHKKTTDSKVRACGGGTEVSKCGRNKKIVQNSAAIANDAREIMTSSSVNCNGTHLLNRIKERLLMMDLINQMDKAKELTHFVLTHQAIPREDKE